MANISWILGRQHVNLIWIWTLLCNLDRKVYFKRAIASWSSACMLRGQAAKSHFPFFFALTWSGIKSYILMSHFGILYYLRVIAPYPSFFHIFDFAKTNLKIACIQCMKLFERSDPRKVVSLYDCFYPWSPVCCNKQSFVLVKTGNFSNSLLSWLTLFCISRFKLSCLSFCRIFLYVLSSHCQFVCRLITVHLISSVTLLQFNL